MAAIKVSGGNYDEMMKTLQVEVHDDATDRLGEMSRILDRMAENGPTDGELSAFRRLAVEPQQVVPAYAEFANGRHGF